MEYILALDIGGTAIKTGIFADGELIKTLESPSHAIEGVSKLLLTINEIIRSERALLPIDKIGISVSGQTDSKTGTIVFATDSIPGFTNTPLQKVLEDTHHLPVTIDNDVNCAAIGEANFGAAKDYSDFLCITYGTGIGGAIVIDKKIYYGKMGISGEFGHIITHSKGIECVCKGCGCYEMYASTKALAKKVSDKIGIPMDGRLIFENIQNPDIICCVDEWIDEVVYGLISLCHIFNPPAIILGGGIMEQDYVYSQIALRTHRGLIPSFRTTVLLRAKLGNLAGIYGAYSNAVTNLI